MLANSSQHYINPDYLHPLPTTLDAKSSPLAMLAQTCNSIGKDPSSSKSIIPPIEKKDGQKDKDSGKSSASPDNKEDKQRSEGRKSRSPQQNSASDKLSKLRSTPPKDIPPLVPISADRESRSSPSERPRSSSSSKGGAEREAKVTSGSGTANSSPLSHSASKQDSSYRDHERSSSSGLHPKPPSSGAFYSSLHDPLGLHSAAAGLPSALAAYHNSSLLGHSAMSPMDAASLSHYHANLAAHASSLGLSASHHKVNGTHSPYNLQYTTVRTNTGATTLVPVCKEPHCTQCQVALRSAQMSSGCTQPGCTQCGTDKCLASSTGLAVSSSGLGITGYSPPAAHSTPATHPMLLSSSAYPLSYLPGHSAVGNYVCTWPVGSDYCGKRFASSEELLQHIKSHSQVADFPLLPSAYSGALPHAYYNLGLSAAAAQSAALSSLHAHHAAANPGSVSPNSLRQAYPRSYSPNGLLAASRYHPYKSALPSALSSATPSALPGGVPSHLGAYYGPYSLYGHRVGAGAVPPL